MYLSWFITLAGAMIASALPAIRTGQFHRPDFPGSDLLDSLELLARLVEARDAGSHGYTVPELARALRRDMETTVRLLQQLEAVDWIVQLDENGQRPRFLLIANPNQITVERLFNLFVVDRDELAYQLNLESTHVDSATLLGALDNDKLKVSLATLLAARTVARGAAQQDQPGVNGTAALPQQTA
jgi:membrane protein